MGNIIRSICIIERRYVHHGSVLLEWVLEKNRVVNQFADGGTISHLSANHLPLYYTLLEKFKKKKKKKHHNTPIMRRAIVMDGILRIEWEISFRDGAILATGLHLDSVLLE